MTNTTSKQFKNFTYDIGISSGSVSFLTYGGSVAAMTDAHSYNTIIKITDNQIDSLFEPIILTSQFFVLVTTSLTTLDYKIYLGGNFSTVNGNTCNSVLRLNSDGTIDDTFIPIDFTASQIITGITQTADGKIYLSGQSLTSDENYPTVAMLTRLNSDGTLDNNYPQLFLTNAQDSIFDITQHSNGKIYLYGNDGTSQLGLLTRLNSDGSVDTDYPPVHTNPIYLQSLIELPDGTMLVGGQYNYIDTSDDNHNVLIMLDSNGIPTNSMDFGVNAVIWSMILANDGKIYVGGLFSNVTDVSYNKLARLNSDLSVDTSFDDIGLPNGETPSFVTCITQMSNNFIYLTIGLEIYVLNSDGTYNTTLSDISSSGGESDPPGTLYGFEELNIIPDVSPTPSTTPIPSELPIPTPLTSQGGSPIHNINPVEAGFSNYKKVLLDKVLGKIVNTEKNFEQFENVTQHIQTVPASIWKIFHGNNSTELFINVFIYDVDGLLTKIEPIITYIDNDNISLNFGMLGDCTGIVDVLFFGAALDPLPIINVTPSTSLTPTPTPTPSTSSQIPSTPSPTPTQTVSLTPTKTPQSTPTPTTSLSPTVSLTHSLTPTPSVTLTVTQTVTITPTMTSTVTATATPTPTVTPTISDTPSVTPTISITPTITVTPENTATPTPTQTISITPTISETPSVTPTLSLTPTITVSNTVTPSVTRTNTPTPTGTATPTPTLSLTPTNTPAPGSSLTPTPTPTPTTSMTVTPSITPTITLSPTLTPTPTPTRPTAVGYMTKLNYNGTVNREFADLRLDGFVDTIMQSTDGEIYFGGAFYNGDMSSSVDPLFDRLNYDGSLDTTYQNLDIDSTVVDMIQASDGKIYVVGNFTSHGSLSYTYMIRLNIDGSLDTSFTGIDFNSALNCVYQTADGSIYVAGSFNTIGSIPYNYLARLHNDGTLDTSFVSIDFDSMINCITQTADGKIYIGGDFTSIGSMPRKYIARLNNDGTVDTGFIDLDLNNDVYAIAQSGDGKIYVGGDFTINGLNNYNYLTKLNVDGSVDETFIDIDANGYIKSICITFDHKIYIGGDFISLGSFSHKYFARLDGVGAVDSSFIDLDLNNVVDCIVQSSDLSIYIGGAFTS